MPELPDDFFKDFEKDKAVPGSTTTESDPWDNDTHNIKDYLDKVGVDPLVLDQGKLPAGSKIRIDMWYAYHSDRPGEVIGSDGACTLYRVKVTCRVHYKFFWVRNAQPDVLVYEKYIPQWSAWKKFMVCPDGAVTDLGVFDMLPEGSLKPDSLIKQDIPGSTAPPAAGPPPAPPFVYQPPTGVLDDPYAQLHTRDKGVDYLEERARFWMLVSQIRTDCRVTAVYAEKTRIQRRALPDGKWETPTWEDGKEQRTYVFDIPNCHDGKAERPTDNVWQPPATWYAPTAASTTSIGGIKYTIMSDEFWRRVDQPAMQIKNCIASVTYQLYYRVEKRKLDDPAAQVEVNLTAADPAYFKTFSYRVPGCVELLESILPGNEAGSRTAFEQRDAYEDLRLALSVAAASDSRFDLDRTRAALVDGLARVETQLQRLRSEPRIWEYLYPAFSRRLAPRSVPNDAARL